MNVAYKVHSDYIEFFEYPFLCSSVYKNTKLSVADIIDVTDNFFAPPAIRTRKNELIFTPFRYENDKQEDLSSFYMDNQISVRKVVDIWSMILDPFLDTEHSE